MGDYQGTVWNCIQQHPIFLSGPETIAAQTTINAVMARNPEACKAAEAGDLSKVQGIARGVLNELHPVPQSLGLGGGSKDDPWGTLELELALAKQMGKKPNERTDRWK